MSRTSLRVLALGVATGVMLALAPLAQAAQGTPPDLAGRWNSASLRADGVGYFMRLATTATPGRYAAVVRMVYQDGHRGPRTAGRVVLDGTTALLHVAGEGTVPGSLGQDGSLYFPRCHRVLDEAEPSQRATMCLFQELPR